MDNLGNSNLGGSDGVDEPIPIDEELTKPIPLEDGAASGSPGVSRAPLNLGGGAAGRPTPPPRPAPAPKAPPAVPAVARPAPPANAGERITGCKVFFAKLHAGALDFMSGQISAWLKDHPDIYIKYTNVAVGEVQAKKTEPNILITVWY